VVSRGNLITAAFFAIVSSLNSSDSWKSQKIPSFWTFAKKHPFKIGFMSKAIKKIRLQSPILLEQIEQKIFLVRGQKVMIDRDLAELYGVETKYLNRQMKRNIERFPQEFMFQLTREEKNQLVTNWHRFQSMKHSTSLPHVFTEHGVAMLGAF